MCVTIRTPDNKWCGNIGELKMAIRSAPPIEPGAGRVTGSDCLCVVDLDKLAERMGWIATEHDGDSMEIRYVARSQP